MKKLLLVFFASVLVWSCTSAEKPTLAGLVINVDEQILQAACGQCMFGIEGSGCDLAIKVGNRALYVDGTAIDDHGDAHGDRGFCNAVRKAKVSGQVVEGRFQSKSFKLID